jgi:hypothetical protein
VAKQTGPELPAARPVTRILFLLLPASSPAMAGLRASIIVCAVTFLLGMRRSPRSDSFGAG